MKISAAIAVWLCAAFTVICLVFAYRGFSSLPELADPQQRDASLGYAWYWTFLATVAAVFGLLSWLIKKGKFGPVE